MSLRSATEVEYVPGGVDPYRPGRIEMIHPQYEPLGSEPADSTEADHIVPIYEAVGAIRSSISTNEAKQVILARWFRQ